MWFPVGGRNASRHWNGEGIPLLFLCEKLKNEERRKEKQASKELPSLNKIYEQFVMKTTVQELFLQ